MMEILSKSGQNLYGMILTLLEVKDETMNNLRKTLEDEKQGSRLLSQSLIGQQKEHGEYEKKRMNVQTELAKPLEEQDRKISTLNTALKDKTNHAEAQAVQIESLKKDLAKATSEGQLAREKITFLANGVSPPISAHIATANSPKGLLGGIETQHIKHGVGETQQAAKLERGQSELFATKEDEHRDIEAHAHQAVESEKEQEQVLARQEREQYQQTRNVGYRILSGVEPNSKSTDLVTMDRVPDNTDTSFDVDTKSMTVTTKTQQYNLDGIFDAGYKHGDVNQYLVNITSAATPHNIMECFNIARMHSCRIF
jgi:hypothetical protein